MSDSKDEKIRKAVKQEAVKRVPKTDPKALDKIKDRTKGKK